MHAWAEVEHDLVYKPQEGVLSTEELSILDELNGLALRFAEEQLPHRYASVEACFHHQGAYARFKELLAAERCLEKWYAFKAESTARALREWCNANDIQLAEAGSW